MHKEKSTEELLKLLEKTKEQGPIDRRKEKLTPAQKYIRANNIKEGEERVPPLVIYYHYKEWVKRNFQPKHMFFRDFCKVFPTNKSNGTTYYLLDPTPYDLSVENYFHLRAKFRRERDRREAKKKKRTRKTKDDNHTKARYRKKKKNKKR